MKKTTILGLLLLMAISLSAQTKKELQTLNKSSFTKNVWDFKKDKKFNYKGTQPIIIDFKATWCAPCKKIYPVLVELQAEYGDSLTIYSIDVDKEPEITEAFKITNIPALIFIKDQKQYFISVGMKSKEELNAIIRNQFFPEK